jgi:hypothetical protein
MLTRSELIAAADRQIDRLKLRTQQQTLHLDSLELGHHVTEAKRARIALDRMLHELSRLQWYRSGNGDGSEA